MCGQSWTLDRGNKSGKVLPICRDHSKNLLQGSSREIASCPSSEIFALKINSKQEGPICLHSEYSPLQDPHNRS